MTGMPHTGQDLPPSCPVCGAGDCSTPYEWTEDYPFAPGGTPMKQTHVIAPHRLVDEVNERVAYGIGDRVPIADAVKYGLIDAPAGDEAAVEATHIIATERIVDPELGVVVVGVGDKVPIDEARALGVVGTDAAVEVAAPPKRGSKRQAKPSEDRAKKPSSNRTKKA
jgi:hypothetical protein